MKAAGPILLGCALAGAWAADPAAPVQPTKTSARLTEIIRFTLPPFSPATTGPAPATTADPADPNTIQLPKMTIREKRPPRIEANDLLTPRTLSRKFSVEYRKSLKGLDAVLNGFYLPLVGPTLVARGAAQYRAQQYQDLNNMIDATRAGGPDSSIGLQQATTDMHEADDWQHSVVGK